MKGAIGSIIMMVEPIKPFPVRQTAAGRWQVVSDLPFRGVRDDRWWCIGHMVSDTDCSPVVSLLSRDDDRKFLVW
jgi:hypothetical protein